MIRDIWAEQEGVWGYVGFYGRGNEVISCDYIEGERGQQPDWQSTQRCKEESRGG